jgi:serine/threonine protein kinase, bacterial
VRLAEPLQKDMVPFPGYCLRRPLGRGGFGEVWEAQTTDGGHTALKFLPLSGASAQREVRSIQAVRQLCHPNLVRIDRVWCQPGFIVVAMERAEASLLDLLDVYQTEFGTPVAGEHARHLLGQAATALDFLNSPRHEINGRRVAVQHRDVKPGNLLLFGDTVKLSDFGTAALLTASPEVCPPGGTVEYSAPEVFQGQVSSRTDQYALAVTYCHLRGGRLPFRDSPAAFEHSYTRPDPDLSMLPAGERPLVAQALAPLPRDRWPCCTEFIKRLAATITKL